MLMMKKILMVLVIVLISALVVFAAEQVLPNLDKNKDGRISKKEYRNAVVGTFDRLDKNRDGILTQEEIKTDSKIDIDQFIKKTDTDNDGKITKREYEQAAEARFIRLDKNQSGFINNN